VAPDTAAAGGLQVRQVQRVGGRRGALHGLRGGTAGARARQLRGFQLRSLFRRCCGRVLDFLFLLGSSRLCWICIDSLDLIPMELFFSSDPNGHAVTKVCVFFF
jgi:hypothetical protein